MKELKILPHFLHSAVRRDEVSSDSLTVRVARNDGGGNGSFGAGHSHAIDDGRGLWMPKPMVAGSRVLDVKRYSDLCASSCPGCEGDAPGSAREASGCRAGGWMCMCACRWTRGAGSGTFDVWSGRECYEVGHFGLSLSRQGKPQ